MDDNINSIKLFLNEFREVNSEENVKYRSNIISSYYMNPEDVKAEVLDWSQHYLEQKKCPYSLALMLAKLVAHQLSDSIYEMSLQAEEGIDDEDDKRFRYESSQLYSEMIECLSEAITNWQDHVDLNALKVEPPPYIVSSSAIKNTRRKMEDRHVIIHDLNAVCGLKDMPQHSYYAIFDGHAGVEAASYCAAHLHWNITNHPEFLTNTEKAISEAFILTDRNFLERSYREGIKGGCTALCCLIRDRIMYIAWVGDSQAVLVKQGTSIPIGLPHKPDREDERCRVEELGGFIIFSGTWRVNGTLAVSRALGDAEHKPYISSEPEVLKIPLDGAEDYVVLACDGLWDQLQPSDLGQVVYSHIIENTESVDEVASRLVQLSKSQGSTDNITTIVVFLNDPLNISRPDAVFSQLQNEREKCLQIDETSLPEAFLNSGEKTKAVNTDVAINGVSTTEKLKNELNSLNFTESAIEPTVLSHLQERTLTSETLEHYEDSQISPALLRYENPLVQNYCNNDVVFNNTQSTLTSLSNSVNSSVSQVSDSIDVTQHVIMDTDRQQCVNQTIIENASSTLVTISNSTNIYTKDTTNLNQLVTVTTEQGIGIDESNIDNLSEITEHINNAGICEKETSIPSNDVILLEERRKSEPPNEAIMQSVEDLEINPNILLPDMDKSKIFQPTEGMEEAVCRNGGEILNLQMSSESSYKTETSDITSPENYINIVGHTDNLCEKISNVAISNNFQTEITVSSNEVFHSTNVENSYKQETASALMLDEKLTLNNEREQIINNNFHSVIEDSSIDLGKTEQSNCIDGSDFDKKYVVHEAPSSHNPIIAKNLSAGNKIDNVVVVGSLQAENEVLDSALGKSSCLLHSNSEADSNKLEPKEKYTNIIGTELTLCNELIENESDASINNIHEKGVLLHSTNSQDFDKHELMNEMSQNYNNDITDKLAADNTLINNNLEPEVSKNESKINVLLPSIDETVSEKPEIVPKPPSENLASITDNELSLYDKNGDTSINPQPNTDAYSSSLNNEDPSLHTVDISDFNKYDLVPEFSSQDCTNVIVDNANLIGVPQNNDHFPNLDTETCLSPALVEPGILQNGHKITDVPVVVQVVTEHDVSKSKILTNGNENKDTIPLSSEITTGTSPNEIQPKDDLTRQPKCDKVEKIQIFQNPVISNNKTIASVKSNTKHPLPRTKELIKTENNKIALNKKSGITKEPAIRSANAGNRRQITPKPVQNSTLGSTQAQQKVKLPATNKDKTEHIQLGVKSTTVTKSKPTQPNVFERLSSTKPRENRNGDILHSSKRNDGTVTKTDIRARNNFPPSGKALGAVSKKSNTQSENIKSKTQTQTSTISNNKPSTKSPRPPLSNQVGINKAPRGNLPQLSETSNSTKKPSNTADANVIRKVNRQDTTKQRPVIGIKTTERVLANTSSRQATPLRPTVSTKLDIRQVNTTNPQPHNSKIASVRNARVAVERSSISSTKMKEGKATAVKSSGQKKESNSIVKVEKSQIQKPSVSTTAQKKSSMPNMDGQGDCITADNHLPEANVNSTELPKLNTSNSEEVPNPTLHM